MEKMHKTKQNVVPITETEKRSQDDRQNPSPLFERDAPDDVVNTALSSNTGEDLVLKREPIATWRLVLILVNIGLGLFLSLMDTTMVATLLLAVSDEFGGYRLAPWVFLAYTLTYVGFAVTIARLSDAVTRKTALLASFFIFLAASMGCGASASMDQLIGFRAIQGLGGAGLYSMSMIIYPEITPAKAVPIISSVVGLTVALAGVSGPIIGGALTSYADWRWAFWINGPAALIPMVSIFFLWPKNFRVYEKVQFKHLDYLGIVLIMLGTVLLVFILNQAAVREYAWDSPEFIVVLILSLLSWVALFVWQWYLSRTPKLRLIRPQFPFRLVTDRIMLCVFFCTMFTGFVMFISVVSIPLRAQIVNIKDAVASGVLLLPLMGGTAFGSMLGGALSSKKNLTFYTLTASGALMLLGVGLMSTIPGDVSPAKKQYGFEFILGVGIGLNFSTATLITSLNTRFEDHAIAQGIVAQLRVLGGSIGVAVAFVALNTKIQSSLSDQLTAQELADFYKSPIALNSFKPLKQLAVRSVYIDAFKIDMWICMAVSALAFIGALCCYQKDPPTMQKRMADLDALYAKNEDKPAEGEA